MKTHDNLENMISLLLKRCESKPQALTINLYIIEQGESFNLDAFSRLMREKHPHLRFGTLELVSKEVPTTVVSVTRTSQEGLHYILANCMKVALKNQSFKADPTDTPLPAHCACQHLEMWCSSFEPPKLLETCPPLILKTAILESS